MCIWPRFLLPSIRAAPLLKVSPRAKFYRAGPHLHLQCNLFSSHYSSRVWSQERSSAQCLKERLERSPRLRLCSAGAKGEQEALLAPEMLSRSALRDVCAKPEAAVNVPCEGIQLLRVIFNKIFREMVYLSVVFCI